MANLTADLILVHGKIITINPALPRAQAVAVKNGLIISVGSTTDIGQFKGAKTEVLDLKGKTLIPGFNDAHNHMTGYGLQLQMVSLKYPKIKTIPMLIDALRDRANTQEAGTWIMGAGYDNNKLPSGSHPTRQDLDKASLQHPIFCRHTSGHMCVINSRALELININKDTPSPDGGHIQKTPEGAPTGLLEEKAMGLVTDQFFPYPVETLVQALSVANQQYLSEGITSHTEAGIGLFSNLELLAYQVAVEQQKLAIRSNLMILATTLSDISGATKDSFLGLGHGLRSGWGNEMLRIGPMKMFFDGSLIGRTAAISAGYENEPENLGFYAETEGRIHNWIMHGHSSGWQLAVHAIGDRAISYVLDCYEEAVNKFPRENHRHRIEHCGIVSPEIINRIGQLGIIPVPQQHFIGELGDGFIKVLGQERTRWCYPQRSFLDKNIPIPGSSDRFVINGAPLLGIHDVVNQKTDSGKDYVPEEKITPEEAIRVYTLNSAYASFEEDLKGSVEVGKLADFTILGADPTTVLPEEIAHIPICGTMIGGKLLYDNELI